MASLPNLALAPAGLALCVTQTHTHTVISVINGLSLSDGGDANWNPEQRFPTGQTRRVPGLRLQYDKLRPVYVAAPLDFAKNLFTQPHNQHCIPLSDQNNIVKEQISCTGN